MRLRFSSAARMRRPVTIGDNARTTCSTSGSSGIKKGLHAKAQREQMPQRRIWLYFASLLSLRLCVKKTLMLVCVNDLLDLFLDLVNEFRLAGFDVQSQEWFGVRAADIEAPFGSFERVTVSVILLALAMKPLLHPLDHDVDVFNLIIQFTRHVMPGHVRRDDLGEGLVVRRQMLKYQQKRNHAVVRVKVLTKVIMPAQLTSKESVFLAHTILHERVTSP